jgi:hypothetical protein
MNHIRRPCRYLAGLPQGPGTQLASAAAVAPAAARWPDPPQPPQARKLVPGRNKYLPLPGWDKHPRLPLGHVTGPVYQASPDPSPHRRHRQHARLADHLDRGRDPRCWQLHWRYSSPAVGGAAAASRKDRLSHDRSNAGGCPPHPSSPQSAAPDTGIPDARWLAIHRPCRGSVSFPAHSASPVSDPAQRRTRP